MAASSTRIPTQQKRSFAAFVRAHEPLLHEEVRRSARRKGPLPVGYDVGDFVQHALHELLPRYHSMSSEQAAFNYACKAAVNRLVDAHRRARLRSPEWLARSVTPPPPPTEEAALLSLRAAEVRRAVLRLSPRQRHAVTLVYADGYSREEAAAALGVTPTVLKGLVQRGAEALRRDPRLRNLPGIAAVVRLRRPSWLTAAVAPRVVVAAFCLAVVHGSFAPVRVPYAAEAAVTPASDTARRVTAVAPVAAPARPQARPAPVRKAQPERAARPAAPYEGGKTGVPGVGGCAGRFCTGPVVGDEVCAETGQERMPLCANQDVVGTCPALRRLDAPAVTCERHTQPVVDPTL